MKRERSEPHIGVCPDCGGAVEEYDGLIPPYGGLMGDGRGWICTHCHRTTKSLKWVPLETREKDMWEKEESKMTTTDILMIGAGSTGCRLVKEYQNRNPGKACMFSYQEKEPLTPTKMIMAYAPACTIIVAGLGGNAGSSFAPEIAQHAKEYGRVFAVITLPFPFEMQRRARAMEALARLEEHVEALFITDLGKVLESVPRSANTGDVMHDVNEKNLDTLRFLYEAHQADHGFSVDALRDKLPQGFIELK